MTRRQSTGSKDRGHVRKRGGSYQVLVYSGTDPVTGKPVYLTESTRDEKKVAAIRTRLQAKVDRQRNAATNATLEYALEAWLDVHEAEESTIDRYREVARKHIVPAPTRIRQYPRLGDVPISKIGPLMLERLYAALRRCSTQCDGKPFVEHRADGPHDCRVVKHRRRPGRPTAKSLAEHDCATAGCTLIECKQHECQPLAKATVLKVHNVISGALAAAVRWEWIEVNPADEVKKPQQTPPKPKPPTTVEAARILEAAAAQDADWAMLLWLKMITGVRRGELLALRWNDVHLDEPALEVRRNFTQRSGKKREKDTKNHQMRRLGLDETTVGLLLAHRKRYVDQVRQLGVEPTPTAFVFSYEADHSRPCNPDGISHRYANMCAKLGIDSHLHTLRHYTATDLIRSGIDVRDVAGQLGHGGGGATTLRVYTAWINQADRRAARTVAGKFVPPVSMQPAEQPRPGPSWE